MQVTISTDSPMVVFPNLPANFTVEVQLFRDGINGKSAYQLALDNGFVGTEAEWIAQYNNESLVDLLLNYNISKL